MEDIKIHRDNTARPRGEPGEETVTLTWNGIMCRIHRDIGFVDNGSLYWRIEIQGPSSYYGLYEARVVAHLWAEAVKVAEEMERTAPSLQYLIDQA